MIKINNETHYSIDDTLFVFALDSEAGTVFDDKNKLITGIGKVNAAIELTKEIHARKPKLIVNLGSAGSKGFHKGEVVCCTKFIQRDMDVRGLGFKLYETPLSGVPPVLEYGLKMDTLKEGICGSGDSFEMNHSETDYNIVDMEAYPLALIAQQENIPFLCLKYISDDAGSDAADDWSVQVHLASEAFKKILFS
ncbi:adenosylhomocysteine nucleosidase [Chryseobacterium bernardetii]|uniref:Adenosylhomocysteine nucleosidase n=3 Tax=Chryseobacterium TaxID=59732 RepID=A0A543EJ16_9FLAO|nr:MULTISPECIES: nucleosidase [Chryseobacterium]MDR6370005.1 adenosylhomocysteine nucleosidase [Chryseobacterium vietnamense]MDR6440752.1 adenosylhomocysteine nucleosidase [Chryseobacterium bernardetii]MDR6458036.1 adenosylhomocysteine nucleosidase [Chryseobacterium vietnamense]MDR6486744.1 adenosylhomocysteine nucleosidase [Chryseobacterium vietnamense]TQM21567.1 adenosylhomocysteine nucleosidase [Chryseobacterium aquifrigidense]